MSSICHPDDEVSGHVVGGDYGQAWVTYEGRKQGKTCYPRNMAEANAMCEAVVNEIKQQCGIAFDEIYPKQAWMFHFDGI